MASVSNFLQYEINFVKIDPIVQEIWGLKLGENPPFSSNNRNFTGLYLKNH